MISKAGRWVIIVAGVIAIAGFACGSCGGTSGSDAADAGGDQGWTSDETAYADELAIDTGKMSETMNDFASRVGNWPYSDADQYALAGDCATWQVAYRKYAAMAPPSDRFANIHTLWVRGLSCYKEAADLFARGIDGSDSGLITQAGGKMNQGRGYVQMASDQLESLQP